MVFFPSTFEEFSHVSPIDNISKTCSIGNNYATNFLLNVRVRENSKRARFFTFTSPPPPPARALELSINTVNGNISYEINFSIHQSRERQDNDRTCSSVCVFFSLPSPLFLSPSTVKCDCKIKAQTAYLFCYRVDQPHVDVLLLTDTWSKNKSQNMVSNEKTDIKTEMCTAGISYGGASSPVLRPVFYYLFSGIFCGRKE